MGRLSGFGFHLLRSNELKRLRDAESELLRRQDDEAQRAMLASFLPRLRQMFESREGRASIFDAHASDSLLLANAGSEYYVVCAGDKAIGRDTFVEGRAYECDKVEKVVSLLPQKHNRLVLFDVGANIGTVGIHCVKKGYFRQCVAFEPEPRNHRLLRANVALNGVEDAFDIHNIALSDSPGDELVFELSNDNFGDHRIQTTRSTGMFGEENRPTIAVESDCLDNYSSHLNSDDALIWIDTQGFEGKVLSGAKSLLARRIPLVIEFWVYGLKRSGCFDLLLETLASTEYTTLIDLNRTDQALEFSAEKLLTIAEALGPDGRFTDLMIM